MKLFLKKHALLSLANVPGLTDLQREFYKAYISARYERILLPAYDLILAENQEQDVPQMML